MNDQDRAWKDAATSAAMQSANLPPIPRAIHASPKPQGVEPHHASPALVDTLAESVLVATPPLGALVIMGIIGNAALSDAPAIWITLCAGLVIGATTLATIIDRRADQQTDIAAIAWPMLLIWPLAHVWLSASRARLGKKNRFLSATIGSAALVAAVAFAQHTIDQSRQNVHTSLNKSAAAFGNAAQRADQIQRQLESDRQAMQRRINEIIEKESQR